ncbi:MAG: hypothetical protein OXN17_20360 [Candidatus Poribacteria bacterium]|nr:hypothetical protein [Candidatus Poribacteria bacterium]MDE0504310.1 hypothetical protein [Candidatus Poribacteria bacterium]
MNLKEKAAYTALGGLLVVIGMMLSSILADIGVAQEDMAFNDMTIVEFDELKCRRLSIVDDRGRTHAVLQKTFERMSDTADVIQVYNDDRRIVYSAGFDRQGNGVWRVNNRGGKRVIMAGVERESENGFLDVKGKSGGVASITADEHGGAVHLFRQEGGEAKATLGLQQHGGVMRVYGTNGGQTQAHVDANGGGVIEVFSQDGGASKARLGVHGDTGFVRADRSGGGSSQMLVDRNGGALHVFNARDGSATGTLGILGDGGGFLRVKGTQGGAAEVKVDRNGGSVGVFGIGSTGSQAALGVGKDGSGAVWTWDRNGIMQ